MAGATTRINRPKTSGFAGGYRRALGLSANAGYEGDPVGWVTNPKVLNEFIWSKQRAIMSSVSANRYTAVKSAHDTGKSFSASRLAAWWIDTKPDPFVVTTAPTWKQVNSILWREMRKAHRKGKLAGRINLDAEWYLGADELVAFGRKPADYDQSAFQGIHALNVLVILDEACGVPKSIFEAADSLATNRRARVLAIGNPDDPASHFAEICKPGSGWNVMKISAFDTPAFTHEPVPEYLYDLLVSPEWVLERKKRWGIHSPTYMSKVMGEFPDIADDTVISPKLILEAQLREILPTGPGQGGFDVARFGDDRSILAVNYRGHLRIKLDTHRMATDQTLDHLKNKLRDENKGIIVRIDTVAVGGPVYDFAKRDKMPVKEYMSSWAPYDTERFLNKRAEDWWNARQMFEDGIVDLDPADEDLAAELGSVKWKMVGGRIAIESKEDMRKRGMPSPNRADAAIMALSRGARLNIPAALTQPRDNKSETDDLLHRPM